MRQKIGNFMKMLKKLIQLGKLWLEAFEGGFEKVIPSFVK